MWNAWSAPAFDSAHGKLVPFAVLALLWWKREPLFSSLAKPWWPALFLLAVALGIHLCGFIVQQPRVSIIALFLGIYSLVGLVWGWRTLKESFFPFILFAFCMPLGTFVEKFTLPLRLLSTAVTAQVAHDLLGVPVVRQGTQLFDAHGTYNYDVVAACSGIRSFIALLAITTIFGVITFRKTWKRALMIALTVPLVIICNVLRLGTIILAAQSFGQESGNIVHEWFGFVTYAIALGFVFLVGRLLKEKPIAPLPQPIASPQVP